MKYLIPALLLLFASCSGDKKPETIVVKNDSLALKRDTLQIGKNIYFIENLTDTNFHFNNPKFPENGDSLILAKMNSNRIFRKNDTLFLKTDNGNDVKLIDIRSEGDDYSTFTFIELNTDINQYVIYCSLYEAGHTLLVDKADGSKTEVFGYPCVSPDKQTFVCGNCDLVAGFTANGLEIYKKEGQKYVLKGTRELTNWGPENMLWLDDSTLVVKGSKLTSDGVTQASVFKRILIK